MAYWMNTTFPISSRRALYPEAQLLVDDLLLHRRQGKLSIQHSASTAVMKHDLGLQHRQRHADFKEKFVPGTKMPSQIPTCLPTPHFLIFCGLTGFATLCLYMPLVFFDITPRIMSFETMVINLFLSAVVCQECLPLTSPWHGGNSYRSSGESSNFPQVCHCLRNPSQSILARSKQLFFLSNMDVLFFGMMEISLLGSWRCL